MARITLDGSIAAASSVTISWICCTVWSFISRRTFSISLQNQKSKELRSGHLKFLCNFMHEKAKKAFDCKCVCSCSEAEGNGKLRMDVLEEDERELMDCEAMFDPGMDLLDFMDMETPIQKLPLKLELMVYNDLARWLTLQIIRNRHERGFDGVKILYKTSKDQWRISRMESRLYFTISEVQPNV